MTLAIGFVAHRYTPTPFPSSPSAAPSPFRCWRPSGPGGAPAGCRRAARPRLHGDHRRAHAAVPAALRLPHATATPSRAGGTPARPAGVRRCAARHPHRRLAPQEVAADRTFVVVGDCAGVYRSDGVAWQRSKERPRPAPPRPCPPRPGNDRAGGRDHGSTDGGVGRGAARGGADPPPRHRRTAPDRPRRRRRPSPRLRRRPPRGGVHPQRLLLDPQPGDAIEPNDRVDVLETATPVCYALTGRSS